MPPNGHGVILSDVGTNNNLAEGNSIGIGNYHDGAGIAILSNAATGVYIGGGAANMRCYLPFGRAASHSIQNCSAGRLSMRCSDFICRNASMPFIG